MTTLPPGTSVEADPVDPYDVANKAYADTGAAGHEETITGGTTGPTISARVGVRAAFVYWAGLETVVSGHGYYQVQMADDAGFTSIVDDIQTKSTFTTFDGLVTTTTYFWRVRAVDAAGNVSDWTTTAATSAPDPVDTTDIADDAVTTVKIPDLAVTSAKINTLEAGKLTAGIIGAHTIQLDGASSILQSTNFVSGDPDPLLGAGWQILGDGNAEFNDVVVRGTIDAQAGQISGDLDVSGSLSMLTGSNIDLDGGDITIGDDLNDAEMRLFNDSARGSIEWNVLGTQEGLMFYNPVGFLYLRGGGSGGHILSLGTSATTLGEAATGAGRIELDSTGMVLENGNVRCDGGFDADGDLLFKTFGTTRGYYDDSMDAWRFNIGTTERFRIDGTQIIAIGASLNMNNEAIFNVTRLLMDEGSKSSVAIRIGNDNDQGIFGDNSLNRIAVTVDLGSTGSAYSSTITTSSAFVPGRDNVHELGNSAFRWDDIWATNNVIQTSDVRSKEGVQDSDLGLDFLIAIGGKKWKRKGGRRFHYGPVAQDVKRAMDDLGVDFAGFVDPGHSPMDPEKWPEAYDDAGSLLEDRSYYGLRMNEFLGPILKAFEELNDRLVEAGI